MSERRMLAATIRTGVMISFVLLAVGLALSVGAPPELLVPASPWKIARQMAEGDPTGWIQAGLLVLMLTPFSRVVVLLVHFARTREFPFLAVSVGVLFLLIGTVIARLF